LENMGSGCPEIAIYGGCFSTTLVWRKREIFCSAPRCFPAAPHIWGIEERKMPGMGADAAGDSTSHPHFSTVFPFLSTDRRFVFVDALTPRQTGKSPYLHPLSIVPSVVCALPGFVCLFVPHSLTVSPRTEKPALLSSALLDQPFACRLSPASPRGPRSAVCCPSFTPQSAARSSLFIVLSAVCRPRSAVYLIGIVSFLQEI